MTTKEILTTRPARAVDAQALLDAIRAAGVTHVLTVPDTHQRTLLALLAETDTPKLITVCTEDEAIGINAGLYIGGARPMLLIQNNGCYACLNTLKAIPLDAQVPTFMLIGEHGRDVTKASRENADRSVRMLEPTLEAWDVPYYRLEGPEDLDNFERAYRQCQEQGGPVAVLVGAPTSNATERAFVNSLKSPQRQLGDV
ncbi:MAG: thiamine pyrophosphate-binding protein [Blastocatellia bacterium]